MLLLFYVFVMPLAFLYGYVQLTRTFSSVRLAELCIMIFMACIPMINAIVMVMLACHVYDVGRFFGRTIFKRFERKD